MCIVSMVFDRYDKIWPTPRIPELKPIDLKLELERQKSAVELFQELVKLTKQLDTLLGLKDCEDPAKMEFLERVKNAIKEAETKKLEDKLKI